MAGSVRVRILDPAGARSFEATIESETPLEQVLPRLATRFEFPEAIKDGHPIRYRLLHRERKALLSLATSLAQAEVRDGDTLVLLPAAEEVGG